MHILFITRKWPPAIGGMETYSLELERNLSLLPSTEVDTLCLPGRPDGRPPSSISLFLFFLTTSLRLIFGGRRYDVIHLGDFVLAPLGLLVSRRKKIVVSVHGLDLLYGNRAGIAPLCYRLMTKAMAFFFRTRRVRLIANSTATERIALEKGFRTTTVPLGAEKRALPDILPGLEKTVLFTGRLIPRKGPAWFAVHVLPLLPKEYRLAVIGPETDKEEVLLLKANPRVDMMGFLPADRLDAMRRSSLCVVMPNQHDRAGEDIEGFGLIAPEAAIVGGVVVAAAVDGIPSAVLDGTTGFLLPEKEPQIWADRIVEIESWSPDKRRDWTEASMRSAKEYFSWERVARQVRDIYEEKF